MHTYKLFWLDGRQEVAKGWDIADAFRRLGYSRNAIRELDYYLRVD